jgi:hypothetical protein
MYYSAIYLSCQAGARRKSGEANSANSFEANGLSFPDGHYLIYGAGLSRGRFAQREIGDCLGLHYVTVSCIIRAKEKEKVRRAGCEPTH